MPALGNIPRSIEYNVDWVTGLIRHAREHGLTRVEATPAGVDVLDRSRQGAGEGLLSNEVNSWMTGINSNVEGKQTRIDRALQRQRPRLSRADATRWRRSGYQELALA